MIEDLKILSAGYCESHEYIILQGNSWKKIKFAAVFALLKHATLGYILIDTGYSNDFKSITSTFPEKIYALATPVYITEKNTAKAKLNKLGIKSEDINYIIVTHFHADHIGGLNDFPKAKFICSQQAYDYVSSLSRLKGVTRGVLKKLIPEDFKSRMIPIEKMLSKKNKYFDTSYTWDTDGLFEFIFIPGHAKHQIGCMIKTNNKEFFFCADASWHRDNHEKLHLPSKLTKLFFDSWDDFTDSLYKINKYHLQNPTVEIIPTHCPIMFDKYVKEY